MSNVSHNIVTLNEITTVIFGSAFDSKFFSKDSGIPLIRIRDLKSGRTETYYTGKYSEKYLVYPGDLLVGMDGEFNAVKWRGQPGLLNQRVAKITPISNKCDCTYLYYAIGKYLKVIEDQTPFVTVKHLSAGALQNISLPLPPLEEQRRVAAILHSGDAIGLKRQYTLKLADDFLSSSFHHVCGYKNYDYHKWPTVNVESIAKSLHTGPFGSSLRHSEFVDKGVAVLGIDNVVANRFEWRERRYITSEKYDGLKRYTAVPGDVLISIMGTTGRTAVVPDDIPLSISTKHLATIRVDRTKAIPEFISNALQKDPELLYQMQRAGKGAIMTGLNLGIIKSLQLRLPPLSVQQQFLSIYQRYMSFEQKIRNDYPAQLTASLMNRFFSGH